MSDLTYDQLASAEITLAFRHRDDYFVCVKNGGNSIYRVNPKSRAVEWMYFSTWDGWDVCEEIDPKDVKL